MYYRVIAPHRSEYPDPIRLRRGEALGVGERYEGPEGWDDWIFCSTASHPGGWVPAQLIEATGPGVGRAMADYSARELDVNEGEALTGERELNGWAWCVRSGGLDAGWVPLANLVRVAAA